MGESWRFCEKFILIGHYQFKKGSGAVNAVFDVSNLFKDQLTHVNNTFI
jgi:hypothetical protein